MAISDYNKNGRIPIVPLPYSRRSEAQGKELIVDYPNGGIYIADENDPSILYNITQNIIDNISTMDASGMDITITLPNETEVVLRLGDVVQALYNNAIQADIENVENLDRYLVQLQQAFVKDSTNKYYSPITSSDSVYLPNGDKLTDRVNSISRIGVSSISVECEEDGQRTFNIPFPTDTYVRDGNTFEVFVGSTLMSKDRYETVDYVENEIDTGYILFVNEDDGLSVGRSVTFLFIYNSSTDNATALKPMSGQYIADKSIPTSKLSNISNAIDNNNSSSLATSKAVKTLNDVLSDRMNKICGNIAAFGTSYGNGLNLSVTLNHYKLKDNSIIYLRLHTNLQSQATLSVNAGTAYPIYVNDTREVAGPQAGETIALCFNSRNNRFQLFSELSKYKIDTSFYSYTATANETSIYFDIESYNQVLDKLNVYYNGIRLFENIDYVINNNSSISLTSITTKTNDRLYFEVDRVVPILT